jgi:hypothetical protein
MNKEEINTPFRLENITDCLTHVCSRVSDTFDIEIIEIINGINRIVQ